MESHDTFEALVSKLLDGECSAEEQDALARLCREDEAKPERMRSELEFAELIRTATGSEPIAGGECFSGRIDRRISGQMPDYEVLVDKLVHPMEPMEAGEMEELIHHCGLDDEEARALRQRLKWDDMIGQAANPARSEESFFGALKTRMGAQQAEDPFVGETYSKIVSLHPEAAVAEKKIPSNILSIGTWATAAAAAVTVGFLVLFSFGDLEEVAQLASVTGDVSWAAGSVGAAREGLLSGRYQLDSGVVHLKFRGGAEMTVEGPADFEIRGEREVFVHRGLALIDQSVAMSQSEAPFVLESNGLRLAEKSQTVGVDARSDGATEAVVFNGGAEVWVMDQVKRRVMQAHEAVRIDLGRKKVFDIPFKPEVFARSWAVMAGVKPNSGLVRIELPGKNPEPLEECREVRVFIESIRFVPASEIEVDDLNPGQFAEASGSPSGRRLEVPGELRSYLLQLNQVEEDENKGALEASLTFAHPVVGIIFSSDRLEQTDSLVGTNLTGWTGDISRARGLDADAGQSEGDEILLSDDRRTVNLRLNNGGDDEVDHVRVIVALK